MKHVRVAIVGMGIGRPNGKAIVKNPRGRVVALCDLVEDRMKDFAKELPEPPKLYTDYKAMCRDKEIDAVMVGTPNQWHVPIALEAVRRDKHVLVTKPLADSLAPARRLVEAQEKAGASPCSVGRSSTASSSATTPPTCARSCFPTRRSSRLTLTGSSSAGPW